MHYSRTIPMDRPNGRELVIRFSGWKLFLVYLPMIPLLVVSYWLHPQDWQTASIWVYVVIVGFFAMPFIGRLVLPRHYYLRLTPAGLLVQYIGTSRFYAWNEIDRFDVDYNFFQFYFLGTRILVQLKQPTLKRPLVGYDEAIFCTFEVGALELSAILEAWRIDYAGVSEDRRL